MKNFLISIGILAYNEEKNVGQLLQSILDQELNQVEIREIIVVCSGCTDGTEDVVKNFSAQDDRVKLIHQDKREGKASAINLFLESSRSDVLVIISADVQLKNNALEYLIQPFADPEIGMTGGRIVPRNNKDDFVGYAVYLQWKLHHLISLEKPKIGELGAFRRIFKRLAPKTAVDEANAEFLIQAQGYKIRYVPEAIIYNKGPETIKDFLSQRRHYFCGHLGLKRRLKYEVATFSIFRIFKVLIKSAEWTSWRFWLWTPMIIGLEIVGRLFGTMDYIIAKRDHSVWKIAKSAK